MNIERLASLCTYKLILNGTPISRNEQDLFWQWYILDWRILGYKSFWSFAANHLEYDDYGKIRRTLNVDSLSRKIAPYTYQVKKSECLSLPDKKYLRSYFYLTDSQREHYEEVKEKYLFHLDELKPETIYRLFTAMQHVLSGNKVINEYKEPINTIPLFKSAGDNPRIVELLDNITDEKTIIWCKYTQEIKTIGELLGDDAVLFFGEMNLKKRVEAIEKFKASAKYFIANKTCAGYGLNLQFCNNVIYYSNDWDFATRIQSEDRVHRMGQENKVTITDICAASSLDERILKCLHNKERLSDSFKSKLNNLNKNDLRRWMDSAEDLQK
jgi:SNF2 family DNA or RNA helicase